MVDFGVFGEATTENALKVLDKAIKNHGKPASILRLQYPVVPPSQKPRRKGPSSTSKLEQRLAELDITHILAHDVVAMQSAAEYVDFFINLNMPNVGLLGFANNEKMALKHRL